jgi:luciferase family oxidoreductase group 1
MTLPYSLLDLAPILEGVPIQQSYRNMVDLAQRAEAWGFTRYWLAEHHAHPGVASAAPVVLIGQVLAHTKTMRVGAGGVMLPNHAPLVVAEQFGTLEAMFPGRVDLGLGRAPGTDQRTAAALRRNMGGGADSFPQDVMELLHYFGPAPEVPEGMVYVRAVPGEGLGVPLYILGSSLYGAELAALLGLPFAFASHFAPEHLIPAMALYRSKYRPSAANPKPYAIATVNVVAADDRARAEYLFTSLQLHFLNIGRGHPQPLELPVDDITQHASPADLTHLRSKLGGTIVGDREDMAKGLAEFRVRSGADELLLTALIHDHEARCRSFQIAAEVIKTT